jgi:tRNA-binding protein
MNFPAKRVAGVKSEVLVLAGIDEQAGTVLLSLTQAVANGVAIA